MRLFQYIQNNVITYILCSFLQYKFHFGYNFPEFFFFFFPEFFTHSCERGVKIWSFPHYNFQWDIIFSWILKLVHVKKGSKSDLYLWWSRYWLQTVNIILHDCNWIYTIVWRHNYKSPTKWSTFFLIQIHCQSFYHNMVYNIDRHRCGLITSTIYRGGVKPTLILVIEISC